MQKKSLVKEGDSMTMVIHHGDVGSSVKDLELDLRNTLSPYTFMKLKVSKKSKLKDFTQNASAIDATMMMLLRNNLDRLRLTLTRFPKGPTVNFEVKQFTTMKDIIKSVDNAMPFNKTSRTLPFLVMNGFSASNEDQVITSMFQGLFPAIQPIECDMGLMKRVLMVSKGEDGVISIRHYFIQKRDVGLSESIQSIVDGAIPDLSEYESIEDYVIEKSKRKSESQRCAIRLREMGPRIDMTYESIEAGVLGGMEVSSEKKQKSKQ